MFPFDLGQTKLANNPEVFAFDLDGCGLATPPGGSFTEPIDEFATLFHFTIWLAGVGREIPCAPMIRLTDASRMFNAGKPKTVLFSRKSDLREFRVWWTRYQTWFRDSTRKFSDVYLPRLPMRGSMRLHFTSAEGIGSPNFYANDWVWIAHNATGPVYVTPDSLAFTKLTDAVRYKLVQSDFANLC